MVPPDRGTLRSAAFTLVLTGVFVVVNSQVVYAAGSSNGSGDLLSPLNITSSEGVPIDGYELSAWGGSILSFRAQALSFVLSGLFALVRLLVGLAGWAIAVAFRFPLLKVLAAPAQKVADVYNSLVVDTLGLKGLLLAWAFVVTGFMLVRGRVARGLGEVFLTLLIAALAASAFVRPDYLLAATGPLGQSQQVAAEIAQDSVNAYDWGGELVGTGPCEGLAGGAELTCLRQNQGPVTAAGVARPLQDSITNALIVKPYMLLQYGHILDPAKPADRAAYAVHLRWVTGWDTATSADDEGTCRLLKGEAKQVCLDDGPKDEAQGEAEAACEHIKGPAKAYCEAGAGSDAGLPDGSGDLLDASGATIADDDQKFLAFLGEMSKAGDVGKACAEYAEKPTWWRVGGAGLLLLAALFICGMLLSSAIVLLGTQAVCAAAAAVGGLTFVAGMLPGPARQSVWKWLSLWGIAVLALIAVCAFVPFFGIAVDATITDGPDLMVERILLIDVLAIAGTAGHRRLLAGISSFGRRMAMRMRYAKIGGTHLPGDTSELGAALAMNSPAGLGGYGGGLRAFTGGGRGRFGLLGTRQRLLGALASVFDSAGMPVDTGRILTDATAEAGRGLAPLSAAAAVGGLGARLGGRGAHWLLIGRRPDREQLAKWRKSTADGDDPPAGGPDGGGGDGAGGGGPRRPGGPPDRYRDDDGQVVDRTSGQVLHAQHGDRTLLSTRAHNRLVRFRGYRILHRGGRIAHGATVGLPETVRRARAGGTRYSQDARQQVRVWGNTVREDARAWADTGRHISRVLRNNTDDRGGNAPFTNRRLPGIPPAASRSALAQPPPGTGTAPGRSRPAATRLAAPASPPGGGSAQASPPLLSPAPPQTPAPPPTGPVLPGGRSTTGGARDEARRRMQELMRRTEPEAQRLRQQRAQRRDEDGEEE
ncbi:hypothetical protein GCM10010129_76190 [Streptomyces fumigatiscleroticus]|nr:hypothetical protein GCM10010129_76190 [Streptomyces fumigatiscleroticus]